jgi:hypothetical protein
MMLFCKSLAQKRLERARRWLAERDNAFVVASTTYVLIEKPNT